MGFEPTTSSLGKSTGKPSKRLGNLVLRSKLATERAIRKASHGIAFFRVLSGYFHDLGVEGVRTPDVN